MRHGNKPAGLSAVGPPTTGSGIRPHASSGLLPRPRAGMGRRGVSSAARGRFVARRWSRPQLSLGLRARVRTWAVPCAGRGGSGSRFLALCVAASWVDACNYLHWDKPYRMSRRFCLQKNGPRLRASALALEEGICSWIFLWMVWSFFFLVSGKTKPIKVAVPLCFHAFASGILLSDQTPTCTAFFFFALLYGGM